MTYLCANEKSKYSDCLIYGEFVPLDLKNDEIIAYSRKDYDTERIKQLPDYEENYM